MKSKELTIEHKLNCLALIYEWVRLSNSCICVALYNYLNIYFQVNIKFNDNPKKTINELKEYFPELMKGIKRRIILNGHYPYAWKIGSKKRLKYIKKVEKKLLKQYATIKSKRRTQI